MSRLWQLLVVLVIFAYLIKAAIEFIVPLVPYMLIAVVVGAVGYWFYQRRRQW